MHQAEYARMYELEDQYWWFVARRQLALYFIGKYSPQNGKILDVGCGTGKGQEAFQKFGEVFGADFSHEALKFSKNRGLERLIQANAECLPITSQTLDTVVSLDTIEHVPDDEAAIREIARVLKPGGVAVINVPAYQWLWGPHDIALMHQRRYHRKQLRKLVEDSGLQVERLTFHIFFLFPAVVLSRLFGKLNRGVPEARLPKLPRAVETILATIQRFELKCIEKFDLPWGSSIVLVARKPEAD